MFFGPEISIAFSFLRSFVGALYFYVCSSEELFASEFTLLSNLNCSIKSYRISISFKACCISEFLFMWLSFSFDPSMVFNVIVLYFSPQIITVSHFPTMPVCLGQSNYPGLLLISISGHGL